MVSLKEGIAAKHQQAERALFSQRMFKGELAEEEYVDYLHQQLGIFTGIEANRELPHESLARVCNILDDIRELAEVGIFDLLDSTKKYQEYLKSLSADQILPHIYLNYLALAYGGQMMKSKVPGSGTMYIFENMQECVGSIRAIQKDEWVDEANLGLDYIINIYNELQSYAGSDC